jgi:hypothetical protein
VTVAGGTQALFAPSLALPAARRTETGGRLFAPVRAGGLVVTLSRPSRTALPYPLEFDVAHLGATEAGEVVVPASRIATGVIAGQVTTGDAPFSRLCVAAGWAGGRDGASRPRGTFSSPLDAGGRYALELPPGAYRLRVVDMRSGLTVAQGDAPVEVEAGAQVDAPLVPSLHVLRIELVPRRAEGIVRPCTLHVGTTGALASSGMLDLWPGERTVDLLVPEAPLWIKVRDGSGMLVARGGSPTRWVAEVDLDADEVSRGVLSVAVDPPLMAEALGDGAPSGEGR